MSMKFSAPLLEGIWRTDDTEHYVLNLTTGNEIRVHEALASLVDQEVQVALHHLPTPPSPMDPSRWINIKASGKLSFDGVTGVYTILAFNGTKTEIDFSQVNGHCARFLGVTTAIAEQMRDTVTEAGLGDMVKGLTEQAEALKTLVDQLVPGEK